MPPFLRYGATKIDIGHRYVRNGECTIGLTRNVTPPHRTTRWRTPLPQHPTTALAPHHILTFDLDDRLPNTDPYCPHVRIMVRQQRKMMERQVYIYVASFPGRNTAWSTLFCACALFPGKPGNQCTFEHFPFTFPVILRKTCSHITLGMVSQLVLEREEFTAGAQYGLRRIGNGKTHI